VSSNGQGLKKELKGLAARNACTQTGDNARRRRFKLARDVKAVEVRLDRELHISELKPTCNEWFSRSQPFLDSGEAFEDHLASFLAELGKVRTPTGEGETLNKALEAVSKLPISELPVIPGMPDAPESWRTLAALHRELRRLSTKKNKSYFLSYRDAAKAFLGLSPQKAHNITQAFARLGVIKIVRKGQPRLNGGKAAEFRYLLPEPESAEEDDDEIPV
jgi:hypothetical protein